MLSYSAAQYINSNLCTFNIHLFSAPLNKVGHIVSSLEGARLSKIITGYTIYRKLEFFAQTWIFLVEVSGYLGDVVSVMTKKDACFQDIQKRSYINADIIEFLKPFCQVLLHGIQVLFASLVRADASRTGFLNP